MRELKFVLKRSFCVLSLLLFFNLSANSDPGSAHKLKIIENALAAGGVSKCIILNSSPTAFKGAVIEPVPNGYKVDFVELISPCPSANGYIWPPCNAGASNIDKVLVCVLMDLNFNPQVVDCY